MELLLCPASSDNRFAVSLWTIEETGNGVSVRRGPTIDWVLYSQKLEEAHMMKAPALGQIDACLARREPVRTLLHSSRGELKGLEFEPAQMIPKDFNKSVLAA